MTLKILLCTCIAADADNEGSSNYLKSKWRVGYLVINRHKSPRCFRTCSANEDDLYWNNMVGRAAKSMHESKYMAFLTNLYKTDRRKFIENVQNTTESGIKSLDTDDNGFISAEEFYTEHLCRGFKLESIKKILNVLKPTDIEIPNSEFIYADVQLQTATEDNGLSITYDAWKASVFD